MLFSRHQSIRDKCLLWFAVIVLCVGVWFSFGKFSKLRKKTSDRAFSGAARHSRPNILLIVTDDQDIGSVKYMPKLNNLLIENGVTFTNTFVASPVCIPSRASLLLGQHVHRHNVTEDSMAFYEQKLEERTMAVMLQDAGYETVLIGKYFNGSYKPRNVPRGWDQWYGILTDNQYYNYTLNENGKAIQYGDRPADYISDVLAEKAGHFLKNRDTDTPFFMYLNTVAPHSPVTPAPRYQHSMESVEIVLDYEQDISDKPEWVRNYTQLNAEFLKQIEPYVIPWHRDRYRTMLSVDDMLENLIHTLAEQGTLENTYIFYISDNGDGNTGHIPASAKLTPYEEGIRVPFFVSGPGVPKNVTTEHLVSSTDLFPTMAAIAGVPVPPETDGVSLLPLLGSESVPVAEWRDAVVVELGEITKWPWKSIPPMYRLLRTRTYKYIEYSTGEREYYDLENDPAEMDNIFQHLDATAREQLARLMTQNAPWPAWDRLAN